MYYPQNNDKEKRRREGRGRFLYAIENSQWDSRFASKTFDLTMLMCRTIAIIISFISPIVYHDKLNISRELWAGMFKLFLIYLKKQPYCNKINITHGQFRVLYNHKVWMFVEIQRRRIECSVVWVSLTHLWPRAVSLVLGLHKELLFLIVKHSAKLLLPHSRNSITNKLMEIKGIIFFFFLH